MIKPDRSKVSGSNIQNLIDAKQRELDIARELVKAITESAPHPRDYTTDLIRYDNDSALCRIRLAAISNLVKDLEKELEYLVDG